MIDLDFQKGNGLLPAIVQDHASGRVLMLAYINAESWEKTLETGEAHYWSRSRSELWHKGGTSGNVQRVRNVFVDCDSDTVLFQVEQLGGAACHEGFESCFFKKVTPEGELVVEDERVFDPKKVYGK